MTNVIGVDPVAWSIDGGSHPGSLLRKALYAAVGDAEGIVGILDCKVHQLTSAGPQVEIDTGAVAMLNRYTGGAQQTYIATASALSRMDVDPTSGASRSDLVVMRVRDPQYATVPGWTAPAAPTFQYAIPEVIKNVPPSTETAAELNLGYPAVELARIDLPSSTTNITNAMIKDKRKLARPRERLDAFTHLPVQAVGSGQKLLGTSFVKWPTALTRATKIPSWASEVTFEILLGGIRANTNGTWGSLRAHLGPVGGGNTVTTQEVGYDINVPAANNYDRMTIVIADTKSIPAAIRGTSQDFTLTGKMGSGVPTGSLEVDNASVISGKLFFREVAA